MTPDLVEIYIKQINVLKSGVPDDYHPKLLLKSGMEENVLLQNINKGLR